MADEEVTTTQTPSDTAEAASSEEVQVQESKQTEKTTVSSDKEIKPGSTGKFKDLIDQIEKLSALELSELVKALEERFGVSAAAPMMMASAPAAGGAAGAPAAEAAEEKTHYTLVLTEAGAQKIAVIKAIREVVPDLGLKEAKDLVDAAPKTIKENLPKAEAEEAKKKIEAAGGKVELK